MVRYYHLYYDVDVLFKGVCIPRVLAHFSGCHSRIIQGYFKDEIIIFKYNCAPNSLCFGKVVAEKQLNEYMVLSDFDFSRFCHDGGREKNLLGVVNTNVI